MKSVRQLIDFVSNYVGMLEKECIKNNYPPPVYTILSQTKSGYKMDGHYSIQCEAMDFVAIGEFFLTIFSIL